MDVELSPLVVSKLIFGIVVDIVGISVEIDLAFIHSTQRGKA